MEREFLAIETSNFRDVAAKLAEASAVAGREDFRVDSHVAVIGSGSVIPTHFVIASWVKGGWTH